MKFIFWKTHRCPDCKRVFSSAHKLANHECTVIYCVGYVIKGKEIKPCRNHPMPDSVYCCVHAAYTVRARSAQ